MEIPPTLILHPENIEPHIAEFRQTRQSCRTVRLPTLITFFLEHATLSEHTGHTWITSRVKDDGATESY
jgi:hypothetical protein